MRQWKLDSLPDLLFLGVKSSDVLICDVRFLLLPKHGDGRVGLWREDVHDGVRVSVHRDRAGGLEKLAVQGRQNPNDIVRPCCRASNASLVIYSFEELADDEWYGLDPLHLLLCADEFALEVELLVLNIALLNLEHLQVPRELLVLDVQVLLLQLLEERGLLCYDRLEGGLL